MMKIMVCMSNVPDASTKIAFTNNNTQFNTTASQFILNPYHGWQSHIEDVAQTHISISTNLYIAIGIAGPKTPLTKINSSKNKNTEAPFFSDADYGIIGDAFDVIPKLATVKKYKTS
ncbi:hypothetical protein [Mucilaginibacter mallensis]|uniref:hypothetical protein n=1 Tax=Mucilaginibacter mallensis TaxID=652787 RepID=UPI000A588CB0|nr:hypothetical protein [Mucilaginibacter mallensis]